jgi:ribosomal protein S17E
MEFQRKAIKVGNSAGVLLPKKLLGAEVKVVILTRPVNIKRKAMKLLSEYFEDIKGIYILSKNPVEILAISSSVKKIIQENKIKISVIPLSIIKKDLKKKELQEKLNKSEPILNKSLLSDLKRK